MLCWQGKRVRVCLRNTATATTTDQQGCIIRTRMQMINVKVVVRKRRRLGQVCNNLSHTIYSL